jgi:sulfofructose kinase
LTLYLEINSRLLNTLSLLIIWFKLKKSRLLMMNEIQKPTSIDVLCIGHACYDLAFSVDHHPSADEKIFANSLLDCGGGPAANAAVCVSQLGFSSAFAGYLGQDFYGEKHLQELLAYGVNSRLIVRGNSPTPLSTVIVKPDGKRALINYKGDTQALPNHAINFSGLNPKVILFDGHEPNISMQLLNNTQDSHVPTILDAGSVHSGTLALMDKVDYLACSEKFAVQLAGDVQTALKQLAAISPAVIITLGEQGLIWQRGSERGSLAAFAINAVDSTGCGDAFHGAFAAALAANMDWQTSLRYASAAGALCCSKMGARPALPTKPEIDMLLATTA